MSGTPMENDPQNEIAQDPRAEYQDPSSTGTEPPEYEQPKYDPDNIDKETPKPVPVVKRPEWGAQKPKWIEALELPVNKAVVSFTNTDCCRFREECEAIVRELQKEHLELEDEPDIKHNFLVGGDGVIYEARGFTRIGPIYPSSPRRLQDLNRCTIDIGVIGKDQTALSPVISNSIAHCMSNGAELNFITRIIDVYYVKDNEIIYIQPQIGVANDEKGGNSVVPTGPT